jgi:hypothetical protein
VRNSLRFIQFLPLVFVAAGGGALGFALLRSALEPRISVFAPLTAGADYLAVGGALIVFCVIAYRIIRGTWTREQMEELLSIDDESI